MGRGWARAGAATACLAVAVTLLAVRVTNAAFDATTTTGVSVTAATSFMRAVMTTIAGGPGRGAGANLGMSGKMIHLASNGDLLVGDDANGVIRRYDPSTGVATVVAGVGVNGYLASQDGGPAIAAMLNGPYAAAQGPDGSIYVADTGNHCVRKIDTLGAITVYAGACGTQGYGGDGGPATSALLSTPRDLDVGADGVVYIADYGNSRVRAVGTDGTITTVAGTGAGCAVVPGGTAATAAAIGGPSGVSVYGSTIAVSGPHRLMMFTVGGSLSVLAGACAANNGPSPLNNPRGVFLESATQALVTDDTGPRIHRYASDGTLVANPCSVKGWGVASSGGVVYETDRNTNKLTACTTGTVVAGNGTLTYGGDGSSGTSAVLNPTTSAFAQVAWSGGTAYVADPGNNRIRAVTGGTITTVAGTGAASYSGDGGAATSAAYKSPAGVAAGGGVVYVADTGNNRIRKVSGGTSTLVAGNGAAAFADNADATQGSLNAPNGIVVSGGALYVADTGNNRIRRIVDGGAMTTVAGTGAAGYSGDGGQATAATLSAPTALAAAADGTLYVADTGNHVVRAIAVDGTISTVAGTGTAGFSGDAGPPTSAALSSPGGVAIAPSGDLYIADSGNHRIRVVRGNMITTFAGTGAAVYGGDSQSAYAITLNTPRGLAVDAASGDLYAVDAGNRRLRRLVP